MANESSKIDSNQKHCLMGVTNSATPELRNLKVDPTTGRLLVSAIIAGGAGTVTNVSVVTANGISGTVADPTTTPALTLSLGAITPTSVNGLTLASQATGFTIAGGTTSKTLTIQGDVTITGALGSAAYTASTDYADASHASQHAVGGSDTIFPADPGADKYLMWDDDTGALVWADAAAGGGASTALDNLASVAINTSLISDTDETDDLGSTTKKWNNLFVKTIELGHASDTTLSRSAAGVLAVEGVVIPSISSTNTLTNKRITQRVVTTTDDATAEINVDTCDVYELSAIANNTTFTTTGTPTDGQKLLIRFKDAGTAKTITWDAIFVAIGVTAPTTTVAGKWHYVGCQYNTAATKWHILAVGQEA